MLVGESMIGLDTNCQRLLLMLLHETRPLPANKLARKLNITPRMVRYRLNKVELWLNLQDLVIVKHPGIGYQVDVTPETRRLLLRQLEEMNESSLVLPPARRKYLIVLTILFSRHPVVVKQFQSALNLSRTTVLKDLNSVADWLVQYDLVLRRRQNYGCQITGCESDIREAMIDCLIEGVGEGNLLALLGDKYVYRQQIETEKLGIERPYLELFEELHIDYFAKLLLEDEAGKISLSDHNFVWLVLCLALVTNRVSSGSYIESSKELDRSAWDEDIFQYIKAIYSRVNNKFSVKPPEIELRYLSSLMKKASIQMSVTSLISEDQSHPEISSRSSDVYSPEILALVEEIVAYAALYLHPALKVDYELRVNLARHLSNLPYAEASRGKIRNPLLADIKHQYGHVYLIAQDCVDIVHRTVGFYISDDEIGYLTMYLAAAMERLCISERKKRVLIICNAGRASAMLLVSRVRVEFPNVEIAGVLSYLEWKNRLEAPDYDLIVSTIPLQAHDIPVVLASPLLNAQDATNLRTALSPTQVVEKLVDKSLEHNKQCLKSLIKPDTINLNVMASTWQEAVERAGDPLLKNHLVEHRYIQAMKDTIEKFGPYMVIWEGTVLLHARPEDGVRQLCMGFTTFRYPVEFGHEQNDPVRMAFVLGAVDNCSHMPALYELSDLMRDTGMVQALRSTISVPRVLKLLTDHCKVRES